MKHVTLACCSFLSLSLAPTTGQSTLTTFTGFQGLDRFGTAVALVGDLDGDGRRDLAVGAPDDSRGLGGGSLTVYSSRTWLPIRSILAFNSGQGLGASIAAMPDMDGDGTPDLLVGAPGDLRFAPSAGAIYLLSGRNGSVLDLQYGIIEQGQLGSVVAACGDQDGDGVADYMARQASTILVFSGRTGHILAAFVNSRRAMAGEGDINLDGIPDVITGSPGDGGPTPGHAEVFSGRTYARLLLLPGIGDYDQFGGAVAFVHDVNGDGRDEILVGAPFFRVFPARPGAAQLISGNGARLYQLTGDNDGDAFGAVLADVGDIDGDLVHEFAIGAPNGMAPGGQRPGYVRIFSGATGNILRTLYGDQTGVQFGAAIASAGNWDNYGSSDFAIGAPGRSRAQVFNLRTQSLTANVHALSAARTMRQDLALSAGLAHGGKAYLLLGSASGTLPGVRIGLVTLPLNPDAYTELTLLGVSPPLIGAFGFLDPTGTANAGWTTFPGLSGAALPFTVHHAFVVIGPTFSIDFASNPTLLSITQ